MARNDKIDYVEHVALSIERTMFAPHELPLAPDLHGKYRETASAVIATVRLMDALFGKERR